MARKFTLKYSGEGSFWMREIRDDKSNVGPLYGPFPRERALFQLGSLGVEDYEQALALLERVERDHETTFETEEPD